MIYNLSQQLDKTKAVTQFEKYLGDEVTIELKLVRKKRTIRQNAYLHVCITLYSVHFGYTLAEGKTLLKRLCPFMKYKKNDNWFLKPTHELDTLEMTNFIDWIRNHSTQNGCYIPSADEYLENQSAIDREIEIHKQYL